MPLRDKKAFFSTSGVSHSIGVPVIEVEQPEEAELIPAKIFDEPRYTNYQPPIDYTIPLLRILDEIAGLRMDMERRSAAGRSRRFWAWLKDRWDLFLSAWE